jgi:hypothetical protein
MLHEYENLQYCTKTILEVIFYNLRWQKSTRPINYAQNINTVVCKVIVHNI